MAVLAHDTRGRFRSSWSDDRLLDILVPVAVAAHLRQPTRVTMKAWDHHRAVALGINAPDELPPTARAIVMRLNARGPRKLSWQQWLELAQKQDDERRQSLVAQHRSEVTQELSDVRIRYACQRVAQHLGVDTLLPHEYETARTELVRHDRRRRRGVPGALAELLPTANQVQQGHEWREVLRIGGLRPPRPRARVRQGGGAHPGGMSHAAAQVWFVRINGRFAGRAELRDFMADCAASLTVWRAGRPYADCYDETETLLREQGILVPAERPARGEKQGAYSLPAGESIPGAPPNKVALRAEKSPEDRRAELRTSCIEALRRFAEWMTTEHPGIRPTQKRYGAWQRGSEWPAHNNFQQFGGFTVLLEEARAGPAGRDRR
jgi:hypothetical protein